MLRNRLEKEEPLLRGVNLVANPTKLQLGYFTSLQNWIPSKKYKIKKKRGPALLDGVTVGTPILTTPIPVDCGTTTIIVCPTCHAAACDDCLTVDTDGTIIARSAEATIPCYCFYAPQLCATSVRSVSLTFKAVIAGSPISGVCIGVPSTATATSFSGYTLLYDPGHATQKLKIVKWTTASLISLSNGTVLTSQNTTLVANDVIQLAYDGTNLVAFVNDVQLHALDTTDTDFAANQGMGLVVVGTTGADDRMRWADLVATCADGSPVITICDTLEVTTTGSYVDPGDTNNCYDDSFNLITRCYDDSLTINTALTSTTTCFSPASNDRELTTFDYTTRSDSLLANSCAGG
ncbi:MAG: hypothetical protein WC773_04630, partial [Patescibacteria group bacterium]